MSDSNLQAKVSRTHQSAQLKKQPEGTPKEYLAKQGCQVVGPHSALNRIEEITIMCIRIEYGWAVLQRSPEELFEDYREFMDLDHESMASLVGLKKFALGY